MNTADPRMNTGDPRETLLQTPMSSYQIVAMGVIVLLGALDGFDVLAVTYAAPGFMAEWGLNRTELGLALSMGVLGMAIAAFLFAPLADIFGRRSLILGCLLLMSIGMTATAFSYSLVELSTYRLITGLGIGTMLAVINPLAAEFSNARRRDLSLSLMALGFPIGGTLGGLASAALLEVYDWRAIFLFGGVLGLFMMFLVGYWILEPVGFLIDKPSNDSLKKVNAFLSRCGLSGVDRLPPPAAQRSALPFKEIFRRDNVRTTVHLAAVFGSFMLCVYFFLSWAPQLVADIGFEPAVAATVAVSRDLPGILGGALFGWSVNYFGLKRLTLTVLVGLGLAALLFGQIPADLVALRAVAGLGGFCLYSGMNGLHAIVARTFPTRVRASGAGFVLGVGRIASAAAPVLAGLLFTVGLDRSDVTVVMGLFAFLAAALLAFFRVKAISAE